MAFSKWGGEALVHSHCAVQGYAVVDNIFGGMASRLREEVVALYCQDRMHLNSTHLVSACAGMANVCSLWLNMRSNNTGRMHRTAV